MLPIYPSLFPESFIKQKSKKILSLHRGKQKLFFGFFSNCITHVTVSDDPNEKPKIEEKCFPKGSAAFFDDIIYPFTILLHNGKITDYEKSIKKFLTVFSRKEKTILAFIIWISWHEFNEIKKSQQEELELHDNTPKARIEIDEETKTQIMTEPKNLRDAMSNGEIF